MANIPDYPNAAALDGTEALAAWQNGAQVALQVDVLVDRAKGAAQAAANDPNVVAVGTDLALGEASRTRLVATDLALGAASKIGTLVTYIANVNAVGGSIANVNSVAGALSSIASAVGNLAAITNAVSASAMTGSYANAAASNVPRGLVGAAISNAGSGMTNGLDKVVTWASGNMTANPIVWFDVVGGVMTNVRIKDPGLYIGSSITLPTPTIPGAAGGAALTLTSGFLIGGGQGYWVASSDGLSLSRYKNVAGTATLDMAFTALPLGGAVLRNATRQMRGSYTLGEPWISPRGKADELGDKTYSSAAGFVGGWILCSEDTTFNAIKWTIWANDVGRTVEWRVYIRPLNVVQQRPDFFNPSTIDTSGMDSLTYQSGTVTDMAVQKEPYVLRTPTAMFCPAGYAVLFLFRDMTGTGDALNIGHWAGAGSPTRQFFVQGGTAGTGTQPAGGWNQNWTPTFSGFYMADPRLMLITGEGQMDKERTPADLLVAAPLKKYMVAQRESNLYWNTIVPDPENYTFDIDATGVTQKGRQENERWTITPTAAFTGTAVLRVRRRDQAGQLLAKRPISVSVAAANAQAGTNKVVLLIGDSLTADGTIAQTLFDNAAAEPGVMGVTLIGTKVQAGTSTPNPACKSEGVGGVVLDYFNNVASSPFAVGGVINFAAYLSNNGFATPDYINIQLMTNNIRTVQLSDPAFIEWIYGQFREVAQMNTLIANLRAGAPSAKIVIAQPPMVFDQDAWGDDWGSDHKSQRTKRNLVLLYQIMQAQWSALEGSGVYLMASNTQEDMATSSPRLATLRHQRIVLGATYANWAAFLAAYQALAHGTLIKITDIAQVLVPVAEYVVKVGPPGSGGWRLAEERDGVMRRQTDSLHWPFNGGGGKQVADELWALMKNVG